MASSDPVVLRKNLQVGKIKWFGGLNRKTDRVNTYGFIAISSGDVYFHQSHILSPKESLAPDTEVIFELISERDAKLAARRVRVLAQLSDDELVTLIKGAPGLAPQHRLSIALHRQVIPPCEREVHSAIAEVAQTTASFESWEAFWKRFPPESPKDPLFEFAPISTKRSTCKQYYASFRNALFGLFEPLKNIQTTLDVDEVYPSLDDQDEAVAKLWTNSDHEAERAKMLSARAAEKAAKRFYEELGASVDDISIRQIEGDSKEWTTHDLLIDQTHAVDVKNSRRPINARRFFVEHTIPRFKLDRRGAGVTIAGVLSPYLQLRYIRDPAEASFRVDPLIFLGETSRGDIDRLISTFASSTLEVTRGNESLYPNWAFGYPQISYRAFLEGARYFTDECDWPEDEEWQYVLDSTEMKNAIPALCAAGKPLPRAILSTLSNWQVEFYSKLQSIAGSPPSLPFIFFALLSDFLNQLNEESTDYSPEGYSALLFSDSRDGRFDAEQATSASYPLGAIDPLGLVRTLVRTLTTLWNGREDAILSRFSDFRFSGLGMLQGRERGHRHWTTLVAYCGGIVYKTDVNRPGYLGGSDS